MGAITPGGVPLESLLRLSEVRTPSGCSLPDYYNPAAELRNCVLAA